MLDFLSCPVLYWRTGLVTVTFANQIGIIPLGSHFHRAHQDNNKSKHQSTMINWKTWWDAFRGGNFSSLEKENKLTRQKHVWSDQKGKRSWHLLISYTLLFNVSSLHFTGGKSNSQTDHKHVFGKENHVMVPHKRTIVTAVNRQESLKEYYDIKITGIDI